MAGFDNKFIRSVSEWVSIPRDDGLPPWESGGDEVFCMSVNVYEGKITVDHAAIGGTGSDGLDDVEVLRRLKPGEPYARLSTKNLIQGRKLALCLSENRICYVNVQKVIYPWWFQFQAPNELAKWPEGESGAPLFDEDNCLAGMVIRWWPSSGMVEAISSRMIRMKVSPSQTGM